MLFASCEILTLWYAVEEKNNLYGIESLLKLRCRNFSPMQNDELYPLFDENGDLVALSIGYSRKMKDKRIDYFDTFTKDRHIKWKMTDGKEWTEIENEQIKIGKIPAVYVYRPTPIWEDTSKLVYEMEWAMSRNGNYLRRNSKPIFAVFADKHIQYGDEKDEKREFRSILQYPAGSTATYITWAQAINNLKFYVSELRQMFFTQLQLPDWSYESMKATPMSGESRKQLFIDAMLKVSDESGRLLEFFDREVNVVKAFLKSMLNSSYHSDIDSLAVEIVITPYTVTEEKDTIQTILMKNGGKALISHRESIEEYGQSTNPEETMRAIQEESKFHLFELTE